MKNVYVEIKGVVTTDGEADTMSFSTEGRLYKKAGKYYIQYTESEALGVGDCKTVLKVNPAGTVILLRSGGSNTQMVFEEGKQHISCYETEIGNLNVIISTGSLAIDLIDDGCSVTIDYSLTINAAAKTQNHLEVRVRS